MKPKIQIITNKDLIKCKKASALMFFSQKNK